LLSACQATSIPITTVLPDPVAIFIASRGRPPLKSAFSFRSSFSIQASPKPLATSVR
jgi:hypothetical protein